MKEHEFAEWHAGHADSCHVNHEGSSGAMEGAAAVMLWGRSLNYQLMYTAFISDGDSNAFYAVRSMNDGPRAL